MALTCEHAKHYFTRTWILRQGHQSHALNSLCSKANRDDQHTRDLARDQVEVGTATLTRVMESSAPLDDGHAYAALLTEFVQVKLLVPHITNSYSGAKNAAS